MSDTQIKVDTGLLREYASRLKKVNSRLKALEGDLEALYRREGLVDIGAILRSGDIGWNKTIDSAATYLLETAEDFENVEKEICDMVARSMQGEYPFACFDDGQQSDVTQDPWTIAGGLSQLDGNVEDGPQQLPAIYDQMLGILTGQQRQLIESGKESMTSIFGQLSSVQQGQIEQLVQGRTDIPSLADSLPEYIRDAVEGSPAGLLDQTYSYLYVNYINNARTLEVSNWQVGCGEFTPSLRDAWEQTGYDPNIVKSMLSNYITGDGNLASMSYTYDKVNIADLAMLYGYMKALDIGRMSSTVSEGKFTPFKFPENGASETVTEGTGDAIKGGTDFYVAPNGKTLPGQYKEWIGTNIRESLINSVDDPTLKKAIGEVYRPGSIIGDGGTADIIRFERETGIQLSKSGHSQKGVDMSKYFRKLVDSGTLSASDTKVAQDIVNKLNTALGGK